MTRHQGHPMTARDIVTRMQCITCRRRLAHERAQDGSDPQVCVECRETSVTRDWAGPGIPLAVDIDEAIKLAKVTIKWHEEYRAASKSVEHLVAVPEAYEPGDDEVLAIALLALHASRDAEAKELIATAMRRGFEFAQDKAWVSEDNGWHRVDPYIDWTLADREFNAAVDDLIRLRAGKEKQDAE